MGPTAMSFVQMDGGIRGAGAAAKQRGLEFKQWVGALFNNSCCNVHLWYFNSHFPKFIYLFIFLKLKLPKRRLLFPTRGRPAFHQITAACLNISYLIKDT